MAIMRSMLVFVMMLVTIGTTLSVPAIGVSAQTTDTEENAVETISSGLDEAASGLYSKDVTAPVFIGNLIKTLLAATGIVFLILTVYAGILYMIAQGDDGKVKKAKSMLSSAVIGLIIIVGAYALASYVVNALSEAATTTPSTTSPS